MPSKSKSQQRFFGMVDAYKKGEMKNASKKIKKAAKGMSMDDVKDFAETKHKGLPEKVEENIMNKKLIRLTESDLHRMVKESVNRILKEGTINWLDQGLFDGRPHTFTVDVYTQSEGRFGYAFSNIVSEKDLDAAVREKFPDVLHWNHPRRSN